MGAENGHRTFGHFGELLDEARSHRLETLDHVPVVHDLVADIDRRTIFAQSQLDDLNRPDDTGAEAARLR